MNSSRHALIGLFILLMVLANVLAADATLGERALTVVVASMGFHFFYGFLFDADIHMTGYTVPKGERPLLRFMLGVTGLGIVIGVVGALF